MDGVIKIYSNSIDLCDGPEWIKLKMYALFIVSNSGIRLSAHMFCEKLDFQNSSSANHDKMFWTTVMYWKFLHFSDAI
jgi:hypothetical protein